MKRKPKGKCKCGHKPIKSIDTVVATMELLITTIGCSCCSARWFRKDKRKTVAKMKARDFSEAARLVVRFYPKFYKSEFNPKEQELRMNFTFLYLAEKGPEPLWGAEISRNLSSV